MASGTFAFSSKFRLLKKSDFHRVQNKGEKLYTKHFLIFALKSSEELSRVGLTISTKVDKRAVIRNKLKRRLREIFRLNRSKLVAHFDIVIIARKNALDLSYKEIEHEILNTLKYKKYINATH